MNRSLFVILIAIVLILATSTTLGAQGRAHFGGGHGFSGAPAVRPGPSFSGTPGVRPAPSFANTPAVRPGPSFGALPPAGFGAVHGPVHGFRPGRPFNSVRPVVVAPAFGYYSPYFWPDPFYGGAAYYPYPASAYSAPAYTYSEPQPPAVSQNEIDLAYQVGQLSAQVEQLRQQQAVTSYTQPPAAPQSSTPSTSTPTVLVFRDGRRMEVQSYAIVGETLWVLDATAATKIPISDLDVDATQRENRGRGVRFLIPEK
jgi:hypothetical protein